MDVKVTEVKGRSMNAMKEPPEIFWQIVQWQKEERVGRCVEDHFVAVQAQEPDTSGFLSFLSESLVVEMVS